MNFKYLILKYPVGINRLQLVIKITMYISYSTV